MRSGASSGSAGSSAAAKARAGASPRPTAAFRRPSPGKASGAGAALFEFDVSAFNASPWAGLEECGPDAFVNAALQLLFFARPLRRLLQRHLCTHPACLACEARFLYDILAQAPAIPRGQRSASAFNAVRALACAPEFKRLGLLHPCALEPPRRVELFLRQLLERVGPPRLCGGARSSLNG